MLRLPKSARFILCTLASEGPMTPQDLSSKFNISPRTVSFALRRLVEHRICNKIPNLNDMRQPLYCLNNERIQELDLNIEQIRAKMRMSMRPL